MTSSASPLQQLLLPLDHPRRYEDELIYGTANADVCDWLSHYDTWPIQHVMIIGPAKSGKTTLAELAHKKHAILLLRGDDMARNPLIISELPPCDIFLDDADKAPHDWLFHLYNHQTLGGHKLVMLSQIHMNEWACTTKDLASRIKTFYPFEIHPMDDLLAQQLACKLLSSRGIDYDIAAVDYICMRIDRSYAALFNAIDGLDHFLLNKHKRLTLPQAREYLETRPE
jgi:hypothetical protein